MWKTLTKPALHDVVDMWIDDYMNDREMSRLDDPEMRQIYIEQTKIGWNHLFKGKLTKKISEAQQQHYDSINDERTEKGEDLLPI